MRNHYDETDVKRIVDQLTDAIAARFALDDSLNIVGVLTRGEALASRITEALASRGFSKLGRGVVDTTLYRDDLSEIGPRPLVRPTQLDISLDDAPLLLVDDVLFTGRSVRAALNALTDFGRPGIVRLAVLVDRNGRELPIHADFVGLTLSNVPADHRVNVRLKEVDGVDEIVVEPGRRGAA